MVVIGPAVFASIHMMGSNNNLEYKTAQGAPNPFYDNDQVPSGSGNAQVLNTWGNYNPTGTIRVYDNVFAAGPHTIKTSTYYADVGGYDAYLDFRRNLFWDNGYGWGKFGRDAQVLLANPLFTNASGGDFTLANGSPAIDAGTQSTPMQVMNDFTRSLPRPQGAANDVGAFEHKS